MNGSKLHDWLNLLAAVGVLVGLVFVALELRQNNEIAYQQAVSANWNTWTGLEMSLIESDYPEVFAKSIMQPDELTLAEQITLDTWLSGVMSAWHHDYTTINLSGGSAQSVLRELQDQVPFYFGNKFTRGWYLENRYWLSPKVAQAIDERLESTPLGSDKDYYDRIMSKFP